MQVSVQKERITPPTFPNPCHTSKASDSYFRIKRRNVNTRASDNDIYATPSEYIRDLIRQDMENRHIISHVMHGRDDLKNGRFSNKSILDIGMET